MTSGEHCYLEYQGMVSCDSIPEYIQHTHFTQRPRRATSSRYYRETPSLWHQNTLKMQQRKRVMLKLRDSCDGCSDAKIKCNKDKPVCSPDGPTLPVWPVWTTVLQPMISIDMRTFAISLGKYDEAGISDSALQ